MIRVEKITEFANFAALEPVWNTVLEASASNTLTLTYEWLSTWWQIFNHDRELYLLVARDGDEIIGIAPMLKRTVQYYGLLTFRRLEFLASGEDEADEICSDYLDFILVRGREEAALNAILQTIHEDPDWDELLLTDVLAASISQPLLNKFCGASGTTVQTVNESLTSYLPLPESWEVLLQNVSHDFRRKLRHDRKLFAGFGGEVRTIESAEGFAEAFASLIELHQARWTGQQMPGVFASERFTNFHRRFAVKALERGWLKLYLAFKEGKAFAAIYNFTYNNKAHYYQAGVDVKASGLESPGMLILGFAIEDAIQQGLSEYDFLKSAPGSYKFRWRPQTRQLVQQRLSQARAKETLYHTTTKVVGGLRGVKRSLKISAAI